MSPKVSNAYKEEKRAVILEGALHCFTEKGYQATTIDDIVRHLGMSKGLIYNYFSSKEEMYIQMADTRMNGMVETLTEQFQEIPSAADKLRHLFAKFYRQSLDELRKWLPFQMEFTIYAGRQPELTNLLSVQMSKALSLIQGIIEEGKRSGEFKPDLDARSAAELFWSVRDGLAVHFMLGGEETEYKSILNDMETMVFRYILNQ
ncbi:hypothetical protein SD71_10170 [Cohnella kolymensis]|uniref:HTH tetR-type domain-containing protein n=1 Tax=Cohnella kolymensis TaxID=1590652 RepID=A0ABR5A5Q5_9BACL|nr:TetR/AcrR family transcriptional regulator [Cohnella kolymensis]KIL35772.1 hypothetical protein SD71_10170 [Cohnella kolymensis]